MGEILSKELDELEKTFKLIPKQHRGVSFLRLFSQFHPYEDVRRVQLALAQVWAERNADPGGHLLTYLLHAAAMNDVETGTRTEFLPGTEREWNVACLVAATIIQWLGSPVGNRFLSEAFQKAGGTLTTTYPKVDEPDAS
jgi:hypothetical protein